MMKLKVLSFGTMGPKGLSGCVPNIHACHEAMCVLEMKKLGYRSDYNFGSYCFPRLVF